ncbi:tRNA-intron endonuclease [Cyphellophora europaea CBS 101466]|uniref:tRNA-splicing endonuclease subunit Sen34 n=1 Tax=Cyphellophora europaea (strain CBS 101466) TaxID=1220924 RepID=W2S1K0_CYPE1|nr:tRNA-intron endonuclease [Cyphellophora europaea CBS 101466]ETN41839.1 tRNA-intron endonuclease [Cyphellophora europaea CBS 101466]
MEVRAVHPLDHVPELPIPISLVAGRYLLFDIDAAIYLRRAHNICGYNIGSLPMVPSQNSFLGLPIILMPEEAQLLVDEGIGYVLDDAGAHDRAVYRRDQARVKAYRAGAQRHADAIRDAMVKDQAEKKQRALGKQSRKATPRLPETGSDLLDLDDAENALEVATPAQSLSNGYFITPTTSTTLLPLNPPSSSELGVPIPNVSSTYPLFRHLHKRGFFMTPGLRFGCQYTTYPGDPLRFHSHFLTTDFGWNDGMNLMDIVGGGRLGTGVKKGFLIGGHEGGAVLDGEEPSDEDKVRTFSIEWAVM